MALKTKEDKDLLHLALRMDWKGQTGLELRLDPSIGGVIMSVVHVDELIAELIGLRDTMQRENERRREWRQA